MIARAETVSVHYGFDGTFVCVGLAVLFVIYVTVVIGIILFFNRQQTP